MARLVLLSTAIVLMTPAARSAGDSTSVHSDATISASSTNSCFVHPSDRYVPSRRRTETRIGTGTGSGAETGVGTKTLATQKITTTPMPSPNDDQEFDLQKARLMARFSSVAYEDPPPHVAGVETIANEFGASVVRPTRRRDAAPRRTDGEEESPWEMAHVDAVEPRSLELMLSGCDRTGTRDDDARASRFEWVALAVNERTSTQLDVWRILPSAESSERSCDGNGKSQSKTTLVVAFRGTRLSSYLDLLTDVQLRQAMIDCADFGVCPPMRGEETDSNDPSAPLMAHSGFLKAYSSIRPTLLRLLSDLAGTYDTLWFTGHSLGAALATLAVADVGTLLARDGFNSDSNYDSDSDSNYDSNSNSDLPTSVSFPSTNPSSPTVSVSAYVFGSPRVGNGAFVDRLARLQNGPNPTIREFYRVTAPGDAVAFLPRGNVVNRLGIDYVHAGASAFLPSVSSEGDDADSSHSYEKWMMRLEEDVVDDIYRRIFDADDDNGGDPRSYKRIRIYPRGDHPPDPLTEIDPGYSGFFPLDPRTWLSSSFRNFLLGESLRSFRVLRGGFAKNHRLATYEKRLCLSSQDEVVVIDNGGERGNKQ